MIGRKLVQQLHLVVGVILFCFGNGQDNQWKTGAKPITSLGYISVPEIVGHRGDGASCHFQWSTWWLQRSHSQGAADCSVVECGGGEIGRHSGTVSHLTPWQHFQCPAGNTYCYEYVHTHTHTNLMYFYNNRLWTIYLVSLSFPPPPPYAQLFWVSCWNIAASRTLLLYIYCLPSMYIQQHKQNGIRTNLVKWQGMNRFITVISETGCWV